MATTSKKIFQCLIPEEQKDVRCNLDFFKERMLVSGKNKKITDKEYQKITKLELGGGTLEVTSGYYLIKRIF